MAKFNEINLPSYTPADGKNRFNCAAMQLCQIANRPIQILSVETDVQTKYGLRHLAKFRFSGDTAEYKFFTDCKEMKFHLENMKILLEQMEDDDTVQDRFIETTIKQVPGSGALRIYEFT